MTYVPLRSISNARELFTAPLIPSAFDDEFNGFALDTTKWTQEGTLSGSAPAYGASFAAAEIRQSVGQLRRSHLALQNGADSVRRGISQLIDGSGTPDGLYWIRVAPQWRQHTRAASDNRFRFGVYASVAGNFDSTNGVSVEIPNDTGVNVFLSALVAGGGAGGAFSAALTLVGYRWEYIALLQTATNTFEVWLGTAPGDWHRFTVLTYSGGSTLDRVALTTFNTSTAAPGNLMTLVDFFRYSPTVDLP